MFLYNEEETLLIAVPHVIKKNLHLRIIFKEQNIFKELEGREGGLPPANPPCYLVGWLTLGRLQEPQKLKNA